MKRCAATAAAVAALTVPRVRIVRHVGQFCEAQRYLVVLEIRPHMRVLPLTLVLLLLQALKVLRDVEHLGVVAAHQVAAGGGRHLPEGQQVHVGGLGVLVAPEAQRFHGDAPAAHHGGVAVLVGGVGRDDEQQAVEVEQLVGLLAADPALVRRGEVGQEQGEHHHLQVKKLIFTPVYSFTYSLTNTAS